MDVMAHHCHATNCTTNVPPEMWGCKRHWFMVPKSIRDMIWAHYRVGQCDDMRPSIQYCRAAKAAVQHVALKEGTKPDTRIYDLFLGEGMKVKKIISGCQTGADIAGLRAASMLGLATGGYAPKGWFTELGPMQELMQSFGMIECKVAGYPVRTVMNVKESTGTVIFGRLNSTGSKLTLDACQINGKPVIHFDVPWNMQDRKRFFLDWVEKEKIEVLNVAGNRESKNPGIEVAVIEFLMEVLG